MSIDSIKQVSILFETAYEHMGIRVVKLDIIKDEKEILGEFYG
jgi:hypothetical protein